LPATAPATVMLPPLVEALLSESVVSLLFGVPPVWAEEPPGEDLASVVMVRSDVAPRLIALPSTVASEIEPVVSPVITDTATAAPAVLATFASAVVVAWSLLLAVSVAGPVALTVADSEPWGAARRPWGG